jgi:hypothetical protein
MVEDTYTSEWIVFILRICIVKASNPMWDALIKRTHLKSHTDLSHVFYLCIPAVICKWMNYLMLKVLFKLEVALLERIKVVVEREK